MQVLRHFFNQLKINGCLMVMLNMLIRLTSIFGSLMKNATDRYDYYSISESLPDGFFIVDSNRGITLWNKAGERIFEYRAEEMVG